MELNYTRENAVSDARDDLKKTPEELLADIHQESNRTGEGRGPIENTIHAQKRFAALIAVIAASNDKLAKSNDKVAKRMECLTKITVWAAIITIVIGIIQVLIALKIIK